MTLPSKPLTSNCIMVGVVFIVLLLTMNGCSSDVPLGPDDAQFPATDGTILRGHHYGNGDATVVLAHMSDSDQDDWREFAVSLNGLGYAAFSFNFRGFKPSQGDKAEPLIDRDLEGAIEYLESRGVEKIVVVGSGMGGTVAIQVAAHRDILGVVTISAPLEIDGLSAQEDVEFVSGAKLFFSSEGDKDAHRSAGIFYNAAKSPRLMETFSGSEHGTDLLYGQHAANIQQRIFDFLGVFAE